MPRDSSGLYTLVNGYLGITGQTILTSQHNPVFEDVAVALTRSLPRNGSAGMLADLPMGGKKVTNLADGSAATDAATKGQIDSATPPVGMVVDYAGVNAPQGWLFCAGQSLARTSYPALFAVLGANFGSVDGNSFSLPDLRGRVVAGLDNMAGAAAGRLTTMPGSGDTLGGAGGAETHTLTTAQTPAHTHSGTTDPGGSHAHTLNGQTAFGGSQTIAVWGNGSRSDGGNTTQPVGDHTHTFTTSSVGAGAAHNNLQPTMVLNKIIRTGV